MPRPQPRESKKEFIARAIAEFIREGIPKKQAIGRAFGFWRFYSK